MDLYNMLQTQEFMPQFQAAADKLLNLSEAVMKAQPPANQEV